MMNSKTLGILAAVLVVLGLLSWATNRSRYATVKDGGFVEVMPESIDTGSIQRIRAWLGTHPDEALELERSGDGWVVASKWGWEAKKAQVDQVLEDLENLKGEKRASSSEVLADFQIDDESGLHLEALGSGGSSLVHVVVGKSAPGGGGFIRRAGSNDVYLTQAGLRSTFGIWSDEPTPPDAKRWVELRAFQAERNEVDAIILRDGSTEITLSKEIAMKAPPQPVEAVETDGEGGTDAVDGALESEADTTAAALAEPVPDRTNWTWKSDGEGAIDKNKADSILGLVCSLHATDVADPANVAEYGLGDPVRMVTVVFDGGRTETIAFGAPTEDDKRVYFRVGEDGKPAQINTSTVDRIFVERSELRPAEGSEG